MWGALAQSAQRRPVESVPSMTALLEPAISICAPEVRHALPPSWLLINTCEALIFIRFSRGQTQRVGPTVIKVNLF